MPIIRTSQPIKAEKVDSADMPPGPQRRQWDDFDIKIGEFRIYVLDEHEWFDPQTSGQYSESGISRHAYYGPGIVTTIVNNGCSECNEYHVNDPHIWSHVQKFIQPPSDDGK